MMEENKSNTYTAPPSGGDKGEGLDIHSFDEIRPYEPEEMPVVFEELLNDRQFNLVMKGFTPWLPKSVRNGLLRLLFKGVKSSQDFQVRFMKPVVRLSIWRCTNGTTFGCPEDFNKHGRYIFLSNHRDIVLDPCLICYSLFDRGFSEVELCVGSNLLQNRLVEDLLRSNRMIKVIRGISARELYLSSKTLSKYIRLTITSGTSSVWIAQREGRTKDGWDTTEQGLLKMFDMSGEKSFEENFRELNIIPMSISYEYEPCDARKARELYIKQTEGKYVKKPREDMHSILTGIGQRKGHIHLNIGKALTDEEIARAAACSGNERYQTIRHILDERIIDGYKLWKTNYMAFDLLSGTRDFEGEKYLPEDLDKFHKYIEHKLNKIESRYDRKAVREIFLRIYSNPVLAVLQKENTQ